MPKMNIQRSIQIDAPAEKIYNELNSFENWPKWSPWLSLEPSTKVNYSNDAKEYDWEGDLTGTGAMKVREEDGNSRIDYDLNFLKPWKSYADVSFQLQEQGASTKVTWTMDSKLPFFLFWMKKQMEAYVGMDYDRGLAMLKSYIEQGEVPAEVEDLKTQSYGGCSYVGIKRSCSIQEMQSKMGEDFGAVAEFASQNEDKVQGPPMSIYHKWDAVNGQVSYTTAVPVHEDLNAPEGMVSGNIPSTQTRDIQLIGDYQFLGNAWALGMMLERNKKYKSNKAIHPFEVYHNNPKDTPKSELKTVVHFPVKG